MSNQRPKIIVLDDDPTGSQTVHSCLLLMQWDVDTLCMGLRDPSPIVFILTNTRSLSPAQAEQVTRDVCRNLKDAIAHECLDKCLIVSRSDSTLRGHYPLETDTIADELGPFDAHFLVPAFFEGGRFTRNSIHYVKSEDDQGNVIDMPVHKTEFAQDAIFPFSHSFLPDYVEEKTGGAIAASSVYRMLSADLQKGCVDQLLTFEQNQCVVVDAEAQTDLDNFATDCLTAADQGKRFLFRSAASLLTSLAQLPPQPILSELFGQDMRNSRPGVVLVGSYVSKTTKQLQVLLQEPRVCGIEVNIWAFVMPQASPHPQTLQQVNANVTSPNSILADVQPIYQQLLNDTLAKIHTAHRLGQSVVVYTSRDEITFEKSEQRLQFSQTVADLLIDIVKDLPSTISFLISKGGITSNNTLSHGLGLQSVQLLGQILPGCCLVCTDTSHSKFPRLPVLLFPGNVGDANSLAIAHQRLN
ncbi:MAG: four-carbon acid sugar kinase family protein [Cyanobacteria bacterium P01_F01_bin.150]